MKKNIATYRLNRDTSARKALFNGLMASLVQHEKIETTKTKAMAVRSLFEKLITQAKSGTVAARRGVQAILQNKKLVAKLVDDIAPRYKDVKGGYTKLIPVKARKGDGATISRLSLTKMTSTQKDAAEKTSKTTSEKKVDSSVKITATPQKTQAKVAKVVAPRTGRRGDR
jgi:large subunit ribosomal protein L17